LKSFYNHLFIQLRFIETQLYEKEIYSLEMKNKKLRQRIGISHLSIRCNYH